MNIQDTQAKIDAIAGLYQLFLSGDPSRIHDVLADDYQQLPPQTPNTEPGIDNFMQGFMQGMGSMFSDINGEVTHVLVDGDYVFVRGEYTATHTGEAWGIPATGVEVSFDACDLHHLQNGQISKTWHLENFMSIYEQLQEAAA